MNFRIAANPWVFVWLQFSTLFLSCAIFSAYYHFHVPFIVNMHKTNLYQLIYLHICARGIQCYDKAQADIVFDEEDGITPYDTDVIMAEYL